MRVPRRFGRRASAHRRSGRGHGRGGCKSNRDRPAAGLRQPDDGLQAQERDHAGRLGGREAEPGGVGDPGDIDVDV